MKDVKIRSYLKGALVVIVGSFVFLTVLGAIVGEPPKPGAPTDQTTKRLAAPKLSTKLDETKQQARYQACLKRMDAYEELRVWKHGGARPGVDSAAWELLSPEEKNEVFDIAGCIAAGGQVGERIVTVAEEGNGPEIETRRVANDRDFAAEAS